MKLLLATLIAGTTAAFTPSNVNNVHTSSVALSESMQDLENVAKKLNPVIGYYDPLKLAEANLWDTTQEETIGFIREAEIKHGRIAMFAFVGYIVHANGITWPWPMQLDGTPFPKVSSAPEAWDAISDGAKWQIIAFVGFLEYYREVTGTHYMKGGRAGDFPDFDSSVIPGGALNLFDPFGKTKKFSDEEKEKGLIKEINNGRLAMLGIIGFLSEAKIEGSVPALKGIIPHYDGEIMAPFAKSILPALPF